MNEHVQTLRDLDQGQAVRLTFGDGTVVEGRVNQFDYAPEESVRMELSTDDSGDRSRYQAFASNEGGEWSALDVRRHDGERDGWTDLGEATDVTALDASHLREPEDSPGRRT